MTNELEKKFFQCFGIEPKKQCFYEDCIKDEIGYDEKICDDKCVYIEKEYPQISDRILLELICILNPYCYSSGENIQHLKESVLEWCIKYKEDIKHQVRTLFEEG